MKQILTLIILAVILWVGFTQLRQQILPGGARPVATNPDLTIDGLPVTEIFAFSYGNVIDGDSVRLTDESGAEFDIRLAALDAPESQQPYGPEAKQHLQNLLGSNEILAWQTGVDQYSRKIAYLFIEQANGQLFEVNTQMIRDGYAWHYTQHSSNPVLQSIEQQARQSRLGLWADMQQPIPPWDYRKQ
ncbi:thermonuclease family protein [Mariniblastus fucicola]|uniref:Thermonuclease n=1 Tax=Mariniblastus fucicola TaxID=980251 RepID=A0A5B9PEG4_9BACT|nr:thermonuclease family protein [Mariniblastus fucicola]QEG22966.1 Thermonuclease precursor [Mariniblastus fucicola]